MIMSKKANKEAATKRVRLYPSTYRRFKIRSVKEGRSIAELIKELDIQHGKTK